MKRHTALTSTYANELDSDGTLTAQSPSGAHRDPLRRVGRGVLVAIGISLCLIPEAGGSIPKQYISYKEYAYYALGYNLKEYKCLSILYIKNQHGIQELLMDHTMEYLKVRVSGLKTKMAILRYSGA
jgi:hypothetical protein